MYCSLRSLAQVLHANALTGLLALWCFFDIVKYKHACREWFLILAGT